MIQQKKYLAKGSVFFSLISFVYTGGIGYKSSDTFQKCTVRQMERIASPC